MIFIRGYPDRSTVSISLKMKELFYTDAKRFWKLTRNKPKGFLKINPYHPLSRGLIAYQLFNEGE